MVGIKYATIPSGMGIFLEWLIHACSKLQNYRKEVYSFYCRFHQVTVCASCKRYCTKYAKKTCKVLLCAWLNNDAFHYLFGVQKLSPVEEEKLPDVKIL